MKDNNPLPYINLNGNTKDQLIGQTIKCVETSEQLMLEISRNDSFHGRNSINSKHHAELTAKKIELLNSVKELKTYFENNIDYIINM